MRSVNTFSSGQQIVLVVLRSLIGWHFFYEGYYKLSVPGWSREGVLLAPWTSAGYLKSATGPLAWIFQKMIDAGWTTWIDNTVKISLLVIGISLLLGLFIRIGLWGALVLLAMFYFLMVPLAGTPQPGAEGVYLLVNKTLIEGAAVVVLLFFKTETIAGLDLLLARKKKSMEVSTNEISLSDSQPEVTLQKSATVESVERARELNI
ncbi:MAG: hypothetical protein AB1757_13310 [Acidobacteriota bacterium]